MASSSSSSSATIDGFKYDVFLSFRGEDTRYEFTGSLWKALVDKGIRTFFDEEDIHKGDEITPSLRQSIEQSRMALVVLSKNYASSSFCLDELSHILHSIKGNGRFVWPIFYEVDPSDVRKLKGTYGEAMTTHEANSDRLEKWKKALNQVANFSGTHVNKRIKYLYKFVEEIVDEVSTNIKPLTLHVAGNQVGLGGRMKDVVSRLNLESNDETHMVGIHGIGGIGKTTLAVAVYNSVARQFQCSCFLENVRENFVKHGLTYLQKNILSKTIGEKVELTSSREGIRIIKDRLKQKKVLLVLDDVDKEEQLKAIAGSRDWFGRGSRVIITTRDTRLLTCHDVESKYEVNELSKEDASELLTQKAFKTNKVSPCYMDVLNRALRYASGLPLALEVIGSHLFKKTVEECKDVLDRYERNPHPQIQTILEVSFDALDKEEKCVFLDIACVFKDRELTNVKKILHAHYGDSKKHHIDVLIEKSLIKISESGLVTLHDLIANMGEEIVRQESPDDPGRRSRLWLAEDIVKVLKENRGTSKIEIILFDPCNDVIWNGEAFKKMENLKTLIIMNGDCLKGFNHLPNSLRVLECFDSTSFISEDFFKKKFENMRILTVVECSCLTQIPDISGLLNLEEFRVEVCDSLIRIDDSVGLLDKLQVLSLNGCEKLESIPPLKLPSLEELDLSYCESLKSFPPLELPSLKTLELHQCSSLENFSSLDGLLGSLAILWISQCEKIRSIQPLELPSLEKLELSYCDGLESFSPVVDGQLGKLKVLSIANCSKLKSLQSLNLPSLEKLYLSMCDGLLVMDASLGNLKSLEVFSCRNLKSILPLKLPLLEELKLSYCDSLESFPLVMDGSLGKLKSLTVVSCKNLKSFLQLKLASLETLQLRDCGSLESFLPLVDGWVGKLKALGIMCCRNHRSIPPIKFASLEELELSCDCCGDDIQENPVYLQHIEGPHWDDTPLKELPFSFQDLTCLQTLYLENCGTECGEWMFPKQDKDEEKVIPIQSSRVELFNWLNYFPTASSIVSMSKRDEGEEKVISVQSSSRVELCLCNCKLSDESLAIGLNWFANVKELNLSCSEFTILPECIKNCHFLWKLVMDYCDELQEIKGIPPNVKTISAFNCISLTSSCTSKLLNQELHKFGNTNFILPGEEIPNWFDREYMQGLPISFWFRNKFPAIALCAVSPMTCNDSHVYLKVTINGNEYSYKDDIHTGHYDPDEYHLWLFHMQNQKFNVDPDTELLENKWNHAVVIFEFGVFKSGIHVLKEISSMEDIRFDNPEIDLSLTL